MDKPRAKKPKTIPQLNRFKSLHSQMKYPAPYSHSWANTDTETADKTKKKKAKKITSPSQNLLPGCCRRAKRKPHDSAERCAPHLKYGIFPQQSPKTRSISAAMTVNPPHENRSPEASTDLVDGKGEHKKLKKAKVSDIPLFVIRPIDKRHRRQLTMSETLHLDIKPRKSLPRSPLRKLSPLLNNKLYYNK